MRVGIPLKNGQTIEALRVAVALAFDLGQHRNYKFARCMLASK